MSDSNRTGLQVLIGMLVILGLIWAFVATRVDKGDCLETQTVHHDGYVYTSIIMSGNTPIPITQYVPPHDEVRCVRWEFPEGRPD